MKNILYKLFIIIPLLLTLNSALLIDNCEAQWQPDVRLTNDPANSSTSSNNAWCIAASGDYVHIVWYDKRDGNYEIYYKRSTDSGTNWGADIRLTNADTNSYSPSIAINGSNIHVVWYDYRDGNYEIYYKRSTDAGMNWGADTRLTNADSISTSPSLAVSGQVVHVVWQDKRNGNYEIYYKHSTDGGTNWGADTRLTNSPAIVVGSPSIAVSGQAVHVVWTDSRHGVVNYEIYYKRSTNGGLTWEADTRLTNDPSSSITPSVSVSGSGPASVVHVVWTDLLDGGFNSELYYKLSTDGGANWGASTRLTNASGYSYYPNVTVSVQAVHIVWWENRDGNYEIYYKRSTDAGITWGADTRLTNNPSSSYSPSISASGIVVHVVWYDYRDGNNEIYYKRNPTGNITKITNISSQMPNEYSLSQNYPNPFNPETIIKFQIKDSRFVTLKIYDMLGREVTTLVNEQLQTGTYEMKWNASQFASGVYFYSLEAKDPSGRTNVFKGTKRMLLIK